MPAVAGEPLILLTFSELLQSWHSHLQDRIRSRRSARRWMTTEGDKMSDHPRVKWKVFTRTDGMEGDSVVVEVDETY
jgi:hypothetical protein